MSFQFLYLCTIFEHMCPVNCGVSLQINSQPVQFLTYVSDDDLLKSDVNKVELLSLELENYDLRELMAMKEQLLREVKTNLELLNSKITTKRNEASKNVVAAPPPTKKLASCTEAMRQENGKYAESGVYELYLPEFLHHPFNVYCLRDPNGGEPWTIIQRRQSNDTDFYRES